MGDFNELLDSSDKLGGRPLNSLTCACLIRAYIMVVLLRLLLVGLSILALIRIGIGAVILGRNWIRLSIMLTSKVAFPKGHCLTLPRLHSDHHPIMVSTDGREPHRPLKQFLYQPMWQTHPLFHQAVVNCWSNHEHVFNTRPLHS